MKIFAAFVVALSLAAAAAQAAVITPEFMSDADVQDISDRPLSPERGKPTYCDNFPGDASNC